MMFENTKRATAKRLLEKAIQNIQCAKSKADANCKYGVFCGILELAVELDIYNWLSDIAVDYQLQAANALTNRIGFLECDFYERKKPVADTVVHGQWIRLKDEKGKLFPWYQCSKCGSSPAEYGDGLPPYCHCCGAKMAEVEL